MNRFVGVLCLPVLLFANASVRAEPNDPAGYLATKHCGETLPSMSPLPASSRASRNRYLW